MIVGDRVRTPHGWEGRVSNITPATRHRKHRICWVENDHHEHTAFAEHHLVPVPTQHKGDPPGEGK